MLPHTITLFNFVGENEDTYRGDYEITILKNVMCIPKDAATLSTQGVKPNNHADLYLFDKTVVATDLAGNEKTYLPYEKWDKIDDKNRFWTLHSNGTDMFAKGLYSSGYNILESNAYKSIVTKSGNRLVWKHHDIVPENIDTALRILSAIHYDIGSQRMRHWEIYAS